MAEEFGAIYARDPEGRKMLEEIAEFDSRKTGRVNLSSTLHRIIVEEHAAMKESAEYRKWKKERSQV